MAKFRMAVGMSFENELEPLIKYASTVENALAEAIRQNNLDIDQTVSSMSEKHIYLYAEDVDHSRQLPSTFQQVYRQSLFVTVWSLFEYCFAEKCNYYPKPQGCPDKPKNPYIHLTMEFLKKETRALAEEETKEFDDRTFVDQTREWQDILAYREIRNQIVHNAGQISAKFLDDEKNKNVKTFIEQHSSMITLSKPDYKPSHPTLYICLTEEFIPNFIKTLQSFFAELYCWYA